MKNVNIPEPCSENWNEMSPTERGAFCQKCAIDVYDFTNKSGDEIRDILALNISGRVCGRIEPKQLDELNDDFMAWKMSNKQSFNRAWVLTLLVVFGMTLFSCEEDEVPVVKELQKTAQTILSENDEEDEVKTVDASVGESILDENQTMTGQLHVDNAVGTPTDPEPIIHTLGEVQVIDEVVVVERSAPIEAIQGGMRFTMRGDMATTPSYGDYLLDTTSVNACVKMSGLIYPNPAKNETTLKVTMPKKGKAEIQLFSINGQNIRSIHSGRIKKGESEFPIDLTDLETGMYLVVIVSGDQKETVKFSKI